MRRRLAAMLVSRRWTTAFLVAAALVPAGAARAQDCSKVMRYESLRSSPVNLRAGPGGDYPVAWEFRREQMPVAVIAEYENWRRVCDFEGASGWVHRSMLSTRPTAIVVAPAATLRRKPEASAPVLARAEANVIGTVEGCADAWCRVNVQGYVGWVERSVLWGATAVKP